MATYSFPALGFDPAPGDPGAVEALARDCTSSATQLAEDASLLTGLQVDAWQGQAATAFTGDKQTLANDLTAASQAFGTAGTALDGYFADLRRAQADAREAERQAAAALADKRRLSGQVDDLNRQVQDAEDGSDTSATERDRDGAQRALQGASDAYDAAVAWARRIQQGVSDAGDDAARLLRAASDAPYEEPGLFDKAVGWAGDRLSDVGDAIDKWVDEHAGLLRKISGGLKLVSAIAGVLSLIPVLAPVAGPIALASAGLALGIDGALAATGNGNWKSLAVDAGLTVVPGGRILGGLGKVGGHALRSGLANNLRRTAVPMLDRVVRADPVDVATGEMVMQQTDVELAGMLPLMLSRTHVSSYRVGRWFGPSWASTLDQRLEIDSDGVCYAAEDGMLLVYPTPTVGDPVLPKEGPRLPLLRTDDGSYTIIDPDRGHTLHFRSDRTAHLVPAGSSGGLSVTVLPLAAITDRNGHRIDLVYDPVGTLTQVLHSGGYRIGVDTDRGLIATLRLLDPDPAPGDTRNVDGDAEGQVLIRYSYDADGRLCEVTNSSGLPLRFDYDPDGRIAGWQDRNGSWYRYTYNADGRVVRTAGSDGYLDGTFDYDVENRMTVAVDSLGNATTFHLNEAGQVVGEVDPLGHATVSEWDRYDRPLARTDPLGRTTSYTYDEAGNLTAVTRPDGSRAMALYNDLRLPVTITEPDGVVWRRIYDERGNLTAVTDPTGATTSYAYDERGHPTAVTDALGQVRRVETNAAGLPIAITDPLGATTRYAYDALGRVVAVTDPVGGVTRFGWTVEGKLAFRALPDGATERWVYDGEGNLIEHVDALGQVSRTDFTHFDLPAARTGPDGARLAFTYDTELRLVAVTNPQGLVWRYDYDPAGNLVQETDFNGRVLTYACDPARQLVRCTNGAGQTTRYARDLLGNVVEQRSEDAVATFEYDAAGRVVRARNGDADLAFDRDPLGRILAETCNGRTIASVYDALGRRVHRRTPSGAESTWSYDPNDQPLSLHTAGHTMRFAYDPAGREVQRRLDTGVALAQTWDANHQLRSQAITAPWTDDAAVPEFARQARLVQRRSYTYRPDGYLTGINDHLAGARQFDLDPIGRVTAVHGTGWTERYAYDPAGNLTNATWPTPQHTGSVDADAQGQRDYAGTLIRRAGNIRYEHDQQGRVTLRQQKRLSTKPRTWRYTWDADDRLTAVITPDGQRWRYQYDPFGRRIAKQRLAADGTGVVEQVDFSWDGVVLAEQTHTKQQGGTSDRASGRTTVWSWEPGSFRPVSQTERFLLQDAPQDWVDEQFHAIVTDLVGTPAELIDSDGDLVWHPRTTLWGATLFRTPANIDCPLRFPGQYFDDETQLNYNYFRYYDPALARYHASDPVGLVAGHNPHTYVPNTTRWVDPLGLMGCRGLAKSGDEFVDLASAARRKHILHGDAPGSGGHLWPGALDKTPFPRSWSGDKIMHEISDVATDPGLTWKQMTGRPGAELTRAGAPVRYEVIGVRDGITIKVVVEPGGEGIITGYPL